MDKQKFIAEKRQTYQNIENEIESEIKSTKQLTSKTVEMLRIKSERDIESIKEELLKNYNSTNKVYMELTNKVNAFRNGVYSRCFSKINATRQYEKISKPDVVIKNIRDALEVLAQYENTVVRKFFVETFTKKITKACITILNNMQKLKAYLESLRSEAEENITERSKQVQDRLLADKKKEWDTRWGKLKELIEHKIKFALSEIGE